MWRIIGSTLLRQGLIIRFRKLSGWGGVRVCWRLRQQPGATLAGNQSAWSDSRLRSVFDDRHSVVVLCCDCWFPAMLRLSGVRPGNQSNEHPIWRRVAEVVCRHRRMIVRSALVLGLSTAVGRQWLRTEVKVGRYFPADSRLIQDGRFLEGTCRRYKFG